MLPFRTEIRNSPREQILKIYLKDTALDNSVKTYLENFKDIRIIEVNESIAQNRVSKNITVYRKEGVDINVLKDVIDDYLMSYFKN